MELLVAISSDCSFMNSCIWFVDICNSSRVTMGLLEALLIFAPVALSSYSEMKSALWCFQFLSPKPTLNFSTTLSLICLVCSWVFVFCLFPDIFLIACTRIFFRVLKWRRLNTNPWHFSSSRSVHPFVRCYTLLLKDTHIYSFFPSLMSHLTLVKCFWIFQHTHAHMPPLPHTHLLPPTGQNWCGRRWNTTTSGVNTPRFTLTQTTPFNTKVHASTSTFARLAFPPRKVLSIACKYCPNIKDQICLFSHQSHSAVSHGLCLHFPPGPLEQSVHVSLYASVRFCRLCEFSLWLCL